MLVRTLAVSPILCLIATVLMPSRAVYAGCTEGTIVNCRTPDGCPGQRECLDGHFTACEGSCPPPHKFVTIHPPMVVVTILYVPPGVGSEVTYGSGSTTGSRFEDTNAFKAGVSVQATGNLVVEGGFSTTTKGGAVFATSKQTTSTLGVTANADALDHANDLFFLWTNPETDLDSTGDGRVKQTIHPPKGESMNIVSLTARQLADPSTIPPGKRAQFPNATDSDFPRLLGFDPFFQGVALNPARYVLADRLMLYGPDRPQDPIPSTGYEISGDSESGSVAGGQISISLSIGGHTGFDFFGLFGEGVTAKGEWAWEYEFNRETTSGDLQSATATLRTTTVGYRARYDVYYDTLFGSFAFVPTPGGFAAAAPPPEIVGTVTKRQKPVPFAIVTIEFANRVRRLRSNAQGVFHYGNASIGVARVSAGSVSVKTTIKPAKQRIVNLDLAP